MEEDDFTDWLIDREDSIEYPYGQTKNEIICDIKDWINGEEFNIDDIKENLKILINDIEKDI